MKMKQEAEEGMDWYCWLSKSSCLDPSNVYEYGLVFTRNELKNEDLKYLNHEFLQSMGISVAKHRLEILKLARKEGSKSRLSSFVMASVKRTKKILTNLVMNSSSSSSPLEDKKIITNPNRTTRSVSGPLDYGNKVHHQERLALALGAGGEKVKESPSKSGPLDACRMTPNTTHHSLWSLMFQDMKPT